MYMPGAGQCLNENLVIGTFVVAVVTAFLLGIIIVAYLLILRRTSRR